MFKYLSKTWQNNHGVWLLAMASAAAIMMSCVWYFNLLPKIELVQDAGLSLQRFAGDVDERKQINIITTGPPPSPQMTSGYNGLILMYPADISLDSETSPILSVPFVLDAEGLSYQRLGLPDLAPYALIAFLDLNGNAELDFDQAGAPIEPLRFANHTAAPTTLDLATATIEPPADGGGFRSAFFIFSPSLPKASSAGERRQPNP